MEHSSSGVSRSSSSVRRNSSVARIESCASIDDVMVDILDNADDDAISRRPQRTRKLSILGGEEPGETRQRRWSRSHSTIAGKVRHILNPKADDDGEDETDAKPGDISLRHSGLFRQMDVLCHFEDGTLGWKEMARWLKYEEKVETCDRWSKPHVATFYVHALLEIRRCFVDGTATVILDMEDTHKCINQVSEMIVSEVQKEQNLAPEKAKEIVNALLKPHKHKHRSGKKPEKETFDEDEMQPYAHKHHHHHHKHHSKRKKKAMVKQRGELDTAVQYYRYPEGLKPDDLAPYVPNKVMLRKIPRKAESANILIGQLDCLEQPMVVFARLGEPAVLADMTEVATPTRFVFVVLCPPDHPEIWEIEDIGRAMAALFGDRVFCEVAYLASTRLDLVDGIDEFIDGLTGLPPSIWDPHNRLEPPDNTPNAEKIRKRLQDISRRRPIEETLDLEEDPETKYLGLQRTGRLFGGLVDDMKRRYSRYASDIRDGFHLQCLASIIFLYFACVTPIVTFGGLLGKATDGYLGTMESLLAGVICGLSFALFAGQPLIIVGATGPLLVFESILYGFCKDYDLDFLSFRFWIGTWITITLLLMVMFDLSALVKYITRFTEESFSVLISLIFIVEAFTKAADIFKTHPMYLTYGQPDLGCFCEHPAMHGNQSVALLEPMVHEANFTPKEPLEPSNWTSLVPEKCITYQQRVVVSFGCIKEEECSKQGWVLVGDGCYQSTVTKYVPDVFLLSLFLFFLTFGLAVALRNLRNSLYITRFVRSTIADFAVFISILVCTGIDAALRLDTPKLLVPEEFKTTVPGRGWVVNPLALLPKWYLILLALLPSLLATILIFLDQQITAVIANRKEHKLKKGPGYHLDLLLLALTIFVCSLLGLPWFVAATVRTLTHIHSLVKLSKVRAPGERPQMQGVREQRVTGVVIHALIGVSVLLPPVLKYVPMAVLYGVFLYMGVTSLNGVQFVDRILIMFMPVKYQPDYLYLRHVDVNRVHLFTFIQLLCMGGMWAVKSIKTISIAFPIMVLLLCFVRKAFDHLFTRSELFWLDHLLPESTKRKKADETLTEVSSSVEMNGEAKRDLGERNVAFHLESNA